VRAASECNGTSGRIFDAPLTIAAAYEDKPPATAGIIVAPIAPLAV
jgi:hypothetical protein